ncbi:hypothetical protein K2173_016331 [Erythroxylum novogranatense]|uniref:Uncharacterized protein n=1 Tax=Erythroxylum novogranatense TaxID=1862640 RepID=A0AAV8SG33_9ROSI|nr:hypothetical protein K2173_016331 [Erythroxylum novogranatense]
MKGLFLFQALLVLVLCDHALSKECTNAPTDITYNAFRSDLGSKNPHWKDDLLRHYHLTPTDESVWSDMKEGDDQFEWDMLYRKIKAPAPFAGEFLKEVSLHDVRLKPNSLHWRAQQTNLEYLLMLDVDRLAWNFRKTAGLPTPKKPYGGWEDPSEELRGHFVGHYLSATAMTWASTHNETLKKKMNSLVSALSECQDKLGTGYLSAFPSRYFDDYETFKRYVWAPYYTIHKILAGLLDQHTFAQNNKALNIAERMVDYFYMRVQNVVTKYTLAGHYLTLNTETGGMNDVLYRLYRITKDQRHLVLGHLFEKPCFLGGLALKHEDLAGFHSNTHIPLVIGSQTKYDILGDPIYKELSMFFMEVVNSSHTFATGGTTISEFWKEPNRLASYLINDNEETCTTYNMLKIARNLFRWTKGMAFADYYERAVTNGILSVQKGTEPGVMLYFLPLAPGSTKAVSGHGWGTPFDSFWCCYGTGIESFSKLGDSIYFEEEGLVPSLYIMQYISSSFNWRSQNIVLEQTVDAVVSWDPYLRVTLTFSSKKDKVATLNLRIPSWTHLGGAKVAINNQPLAIPAPGNFLPIHRYWSPGDKLILQFPIELRREAIKDYRPEYASLQAILFGPYLLAGHTTGDVELDTGSSNDNLDWLTPVPLTYHRQLVSLTQKSNRHSSTFYLTNTNQTVEMVSHVRHGDNSANQATFRLVLRNEHDWSSTYKDFVGKEVMLEPFDYPGMVVVHQGRDKNLVIARHGYSIFRLLPGLDGREGKVSLESKSNKNCYVYVHPHIKTNASVKLKCNLDKSSALEMKSASFVMDKGISEYHPISFVAKGVHRNFLMEPILNYRNETYAVYFNMRTSS